MLWIILVGFSHFNHFCVTSNSTQLPDNQRSKLDFLFSTWEERLFLNTDLLKRMRDEVSKFIPISVPGGVMQINLSFIY
jgi:hypothetical protein